MRTLWSIVLLAAVAVAAYMGWLMYRTGADAQPALRSSRGEFTSEATAANNSGSAAATSRTRRGACAQCGGARVVACEVCGGDGKIERVERVACPQCDGTGEYKSRLGSSVDKSSAATSEHKTRLGLGKIRCPFCNGNGFTEKTNVVTCATCRGTGRMPCPNCGSRPR